MPRTRRPSIVELRAKADGKRLDAQREAERELLTARCRHHTDLAVCDQCIPKACLDSLGFPLADVAKSRGRYRLCAGCRKLAEIREWRLGTDRCERCSTEILAPQLDGDLARSGP